jgi:hypothetical protein
MFSSTETTTDPILEIKGYFITASLSQFSDAAGALAKS